MESEVRISPIHKGLVLVLMYSNASIPIARLLMMLLETYLGKEPDMLGILLHSCFLVPMHLIVFLSYKLGFLSLRALGILCAEISINVLYLLGFVVEPHLCPVWIMTSFYLTFFVQECFVKSNIARAVCFIKPQACVLIMGLASGQIYLKQKHDIIVVLTLGLFAVISVMSFMASENEKKELVTKLHETKQQLTAIISAVPVGIFVMTKKETLNSPNSYCLNLLGCTCPAAVADKIRGLTYKTGTAQYSKSAQLIDDLNHYIDSNANEIAEFGQTEINDRLLSWIGQKTVWQGEPACVVVIKDITEVLQLERTKLESQFKNVMLRSVSHELKTPTNGILHSVNAVIEGEDIPDWAKAKLEIASVSAKHLLMLISDLLDFSQIVSGVFRLTPTHFELRKVLNGCIDLISLIAEKKKLRVIRHIDPLLPETVFIDENRLSQVLLNLLSNAVKFTPNGGRIVVKAFLTDNGQMEVSVQDNGIGIDKSDFERLFTIFGRLDHTSSINPQGVGLGLYISNALAQKLGGSQIKVDSRLNAGSCFSFNVNIDEIRRKHVRVYSETFLVTDDESQAQPVYYFEPKTTSYPPVLVVDDTPINRMIIVDILTVLNIEAAEADNGESAVAYVIRRAKEKKPVKLIVMDYEMPIMNGPTACKELMKQLREQELPLPIVISHTAYASEEDIQICKDAGMIDYIPKPSQRDVISAKITKYLNMN
mmetsp:Transcript_14213/g.26816  ORF Transcript_14213/g.26816 Transcript_14213/m.26816 type:complete len:710 (-) Transcript_14213:18-2147(-)